jgi:3'(2'), 5'-bisphosphate nucleotidase
MTTVCDHRVAAEIATAAGRALMSLRKSPLRASASLGAAGDIVAQSVISALLESLRPHDAVLSEECRDDRRRLARTRVWIVDPLDGTREYADAGEQRTDWAVHVALVEGGHPTACAVALPALGLTLNTLEPAVVPPMLAGPLKLLVSRSRPPELARHVADHLQAELVPMGSAGAKAMAVLRGEAHAYLHAGGQYEWDSCAPVGVALAAGLHASRIDGSPCLYNRPDTLLPDLLICRPDVATTLLQAVTAALRHSPSPFHPVGGNP